MRPKLLALTSLMLLLLADLGYAAVIQCSPDGDHHTSYCGTVSTPCSFGAAISKATPGSSLVLSSGRYTGSYRITKPLKIIAGSTGPETPPVFDGEGAHRPLFFDNVAATITGITFRNGHGAGAGCVYIVRAFGARDERNLIDGCTFINCTATDDTHPDTEQQNTGVGGAISIIYHRAPPQSTVEITGCVFERNYARGGNRAAGAAMVRLVDGYTSHAPQACSVIVLNSPRFKDSRINARDLADGLVFLKLKDATNDGLPVYKTHTAANHPNGLSHANGRYLAYCEKENWWGLTQTAPGRSASLALANDEACRSPSVVFSCGLTNATCSSPTHALHVHSMDKSEAAAAAGAYFSCQDIIKRCKRISVEGAVHPQSHRNGVYEQTSAIRGGRPTFARVRSGDDKPQHVRYCVGTQEWVVAEGDPGDQPNDASECSRGVASAETLVMHPALVRSWRYWDGEAWRFSPYPGGITVTCAPTYDDLCTEVSVPNYRARGISTPTFALAPPIDRFPTYALLPNGGLHLWYCLAFGEWVIGTETPLPNQTEVCIRHLSSHATSIADPTQLNTAWEQFTDKWENVDHPLTVRCSEDCPRLSLLFPDSMLVFGGLYEAVGRLPLTNHRIYRQATPPYSMLLFSPPRQRWELLRGDTRRRVVVSEPHLLGRTPLTATGWSSMQSPVDLHIACEMHEVCDAVNINSRTKELTGLHGLYLARPGVVAGRPVFSKNLTDEDVEALPAPIGRRRVTHGKAFLFYCVSAQAWVIGPKPRAADDVCAHWAMSERTTSLHPNTGTLFANHIVTIACGRSELQPLVPAFPKASFAPIRTVRVVRRDSLLTVGVSDTIRGCVFTDNTASTPSSAPVAGALSIVVGRHRMGAQPLILFRGNDFIANEGVSSRLPSRTLPYTAGALWVQSVLPYGNPLLLLQQNTIALNRGHTGGVHASYVDVHGTKVLFVRNRGTNQGGGFSGISTNATFAFSVCRENIAERAGGCAQLDATSTLLMHRSEIVNNTARSKVATAFKGGTIHILECRFSAVHDLSCMSNNLGLTRTEIACPGLIPASLVHGFGCVSPPSPAVVEYQRRVDSTPLELPCTTAWCSLLGFIAVYWAKMRVWILTAMVLAIPSLWVEGGYSGWVYRYFTHKGPKVRNGRRS